MKDRFFLTFIISFFILIPGICSAFVPKTPHLLHLVLQKIKRPAGIEAFQTKKVLNYKEGEPGLTRIEEKLIYSYPNQLRTQIISDKITGFSVESDFKFIKVINESIISHGKSLVDLYTDILLYRDHETCLQQLVMAGIDTTQVRFQRYKDTICYVVGRPVGKGRPYASLWVEKDSFFPLKYAAQQNGSIVEFFYSRWQRVSRTWYPMQISVFLDDRLHAMIHTKSFDLKSGFSHTLFDIDHMKNRYPEESSNVLEENSKEMNRLKNRIEELRKLYE